MSNSLQEERDRELREDIAQALTGGVHLYELESSIHEESAMAPEFAARWATDVVADVDRLAELFKQYAAKERKADNHAWDSEIFKDQDVTVCRVCATTFQINGNKPCKGEMAKISLRASDNTGVQEP